MLRGVSFEHFEPGKGRVEPVMTLSTEQVLALAPDAASAKAGRGQASAAKWPVSGCSERAVWGECQGSGKKPYQVCVEFAGPAFRCSCPSRKFPCKHALGLLLRWSAGELVSAGEPDWAGTWLAERAARAERAAVRAAEPAKRGDPLAAQRRRDRRDERVSAGAAELTGWLADLIREGLAGLPRSGTAPLESAAARMVDAQAPGLAERVRRAARLAGRGRDWPDRLLEELSLTCLLAGAQARLAELPPPLAATVRARLGYPTETAEVLTNGERSTDTWLVLGFRDEPGEKVAGRTVWLRGTESGRTTMVLSFATPGRPLDASLWPGTLVPATLARYPGAGAQRVVVAERDEATASPRPEGEPVAAALARYGAVLAEDPWVDRWPVLLAGVVPVATQDGWVLSDSAGALPLHASADPWPLVAVSGGRPLTVAAEWSPAGARPMCCWDGDRAVVL
ncbi:SWIM zinc finger domain-containing protein [Amycolatopsis cynarae]|uniref:SWIM zinc finger domain-containing protein n=1 Tax=Amycolatopsis cynarae TaxID=2995223 RepID=A0ABY7AY11_9PSEU|nr:SWIM zinc finger family protein [Amycolatopsis sp. HUAS 11-8]WAL64604.1 SWIM zinc finger domain-containing protein [Amycolatopsis sp. HUAS 11-8]